nr:MAG TPA: hypothetical protein [Caudoviricetes sp.]
MDGALLYTSNGFLVRIYSSTLDYKIKRVRKFKTSNRHVKKYYLSGYRGTIIKNRLRNNYAVTYNGKQKGTLYFPHDYNEESMICEAATFMIEAPVVFHDEDAATLF